MPDEYIELETRALADPDALRERSLDISEADTGHRPQPGHPMWHQADAFSEFAAQTERMVPSVAREITRYLGRTILDLYTEEGSAAEGETTWTLEGVVAGDLIEAGTQLASGQVVLEVTETVVLTAAQAAAVVPVAALEAGSAGSGLTGPLTLLRSLPFVQTVSLNGQTFNGRDPEEPEIFDDRVARGFAHIGRPTKPEDFAALVRDAIPTAYRVLALDLYVPGTVGEVERAVTLVPVDIAGQSIPQGERDLAAAEIALEREPNWIVSIIAPTYTDVTVTVAVSVWPGADPADVQTRVQVAVARALDPGEWGQPPATSRIPEWHDEPIVRRNELIAACDNVDDVRSVIDLTINGGTADVMLAGPAPLPRLAAPAVVTVV